MMQFDILEAETDFSELVRLLETGKEDLICVARNGMPVVKMTKVNQSSTAKRIGVAKGAFNIYGDFDEDNAEIADMLSRGSL